MTTPRRDAVRLTSFRILVSLLLMTLVTAACKPKATPLPPVGTTQTQPTTKQSPLPSQSPQPSQQTQPTRDEEPSNSPQSGGLESIAQQHVGSFTAVSASRKPEFIQAIGAIDAISVKYQGANGETVWHVLAAFQTTDLAADGLAIVLSSLTNKDWKIDASRDFKNNQGEVIGAEFRLSGPTVIDAWTNLRLFASVEADDEATVNEFLKSVNY
jgi:glucose/arabinose dehydrogenase